MIRHDLRTRMYLAGAWRDITAQTRQTEPVAIEYAGSSTKSKADIRPASSNFTLDNQSGDWSIRNPMGPWWGALSRNVPVEHSLRLVTDTFNRTSAALWGSADTGQSWNLFYNLTTDYQVTPAGATISVPSVGAFRGTALGADVYLNVDVQVDVTLPFTDVTGGPLEPANIMLRYQTGTGAYYMVRMTIETDESVRLNFEHNGTGAIGSAVVIGGLTHTVGQTLRVRAQCEEQTLRAKVWATSGTEPLNWHIQRHDEQITTAGCVGVRDGVNGSNTNALPIVFTHDNFRVDHMRFSGEASDFPSSSDETSRVKWAPIEAAGLLRRMGQQDAPTISSVRRGILGTDVVFGLLEYWPAEDLDGSTSIASGVANGNPMLVVGGPPDFAANSDFLSSQPIPNVRSSGWFGDVRGYTSTGKIQLRFLISAPAGGMPNDTILARIGCEGTATLWEVVYFSGSGGQLAVKAYDFGGNQILFSTPAAYQVDGFPARYSLELSNNGANVDWGLWAIRLDTSAGGTSGTLASRQVGSARQIQITPQNLTPDCAFGHVTLQTTIDSLFNLLPQLRGWIGERVSDRLQRLAIENNFPYQFTQSGNNDTPTMGAQRPLTVMQLVTECVETDGGSLTESRGMMSVHYRHRASAYAQPPAVTLNVAAGQVMVPFQPVEGDKLTVNDVTVQNVRGSSARAVLESGRMSVLPYPDGVNRTDGKFDVNLEKDGELISHANWRLAKGTVDAPAYPDLGVSFDTADVPYALKLSALDMCVDDLVSVINPQKSGVYDDAALIARGIMESWTNTLGSMRFETSPAEPYDVATIDGDARLDSGSSTLATSLVSVVDDTYSGTVVNGWGNADTGQVWTPDAVNIADFDEAAGVGTVNVPAATNIRLAVLNTVLVSDVDIRIDYTVPVSSITGGPLLPAGPMIRATSLTDFVYARIEMNVGGSMSIGIRTGAGVVLAAQFTVSGLVHASSATVYSVRLRAEGPLVRARLWATAGGEPTTWHTIAQSVPVVVGAIGVRTALGTGNTNAPMVTSYDRFRASSLAGASSVATSFDVDNANVFDAWTTDAANWPFTITMGGEEISVGAVTGAGPIALQTFSSLGRSQNGVVKAHASGTPIHVLRPVRLGL